MKRTPLFSLILAGTAVAVAGCDQPQVKPVETKPPVVLVSKPVTQTVTDYEDFTGRTSAVKTVEVRARVTGYLDKANFKEGSDVNEGDLLFEIDPRTYQADVNRAEAAVAQAEAVRRRSEADYRRAKAQYDRQVISPQELDKAQADAAEAVANVGVAKAVLEQARLNLGFTKVRAPITGRISRRNVDPGNLVRQDDTMLTTIVTMDPMYVYFDVDERTLLRLRRLLREGKIKSRQEKEIRVHAGLADEEDFPHEGTINFSNNQLDPNTGTLQVRADIPNPAKPIRFLSPGLFMRIRLPVGEPYQALVIPEQALGTDQGKKYVYVVATQVREKGGKKAPVQAVVRKDVTYGPLNNGMRVIKGGLSKGDRIIVTGLQRVRPGVVVDPQPAGSSSGGPATAGKGDGGKGSGKLAAAGG